MSEAAETGASSYSDAGVDYDALDAGKRAAVAAALATSPLLAARGGRALDASRGEPAFVFEHAGSTLAFVVEGLGTKSMIARQVQEQLGLDRFADVAYDTVAAIVNDLCCVGALPLVVAAYFATGASNWYARAGRSQSLLDGWRKACEDAGCTWGGGESPTLPGLLAEGDIELAGSAVGVVPQGHEALLGQELEPGDEIVLVASSGLHANGASLARLVASRLPDGYATRLRDGTTLGESLLAPSLLYAPLVAALLERGLPIAYLSHITGHGLLKLMRPRRELTYRIEALPPVPEVLAFLIAESQMDDAAACATFNMGAGYAVYCRPGSGASVLAVAQELGFDALLAGRVQEGPRRVLLEPLGVEFDGERLELG
ncbi:MAG TPA: AIR synthase related protein [Solirubrobacteraceae bacterium]|jgi:phosphoribosylformylglycinamidine cyclo-ligase